MKNNSVDIKSVKKLKGYIIGLTLGWTIILAGSQVLNLIESNKGFLEIARIQARVAYEKDVTMRRWVSQFKGIYVPVTENTPPNPYLAHVKERDITTPSGIKLTMMNPAYVTRSLHELGKKQLGILAHLTSIKPIRPQNAPDPWEADALKATESGESEVSSVEEIEGKEYMRLLRPLIVEESCLECHLGQGYKLGDVRGGISVSIPMAPIWAIHNENLRKSIMVHALLWAFGVLGILIGGRRVLQGEVELSQAREEAIKASKAKSDFLASMSHEIRTPMNAILGMTELLSEADVTAEQKKEYLDTLNSAGEGLLFLINDILDLSRIESGHMELDLTDFYIRDLVQKTIKIMEIHASQKGIILKSSISDNVPEILVGDPNRLRQVFINLIHNAIKFTGKGEVELRIDKDFGNEHECTLRFIVKDTGIGIAKDRWNDIFNEFTQADNSTHADFGGTGLGLTICKRLIEMMNGRIWVKSELGKGSEFTFTARLSISKDTGAETVRPSTVKPVIEAKQAKPDDSLKEEPTPMRILLAEDEPQNVSLIRAFLKNTDYTLDVANNGKVAYEKFISNDYNIVIMDILMPVMDGLTATKEIRKWEQDNHVGETPIIILTAYAMGKHVEEAIFAGCDEYLTKPIRKDTLLKTLEKYSS